MTMASDGERRHIAAALRQMAANNEGAIDARRAAELSDAAQVLMGVNVLPDCAAVLRRYADLIDRSACRMRLWSDSGVFRCTACGHPFDGFQTFDGTGHWDDFRYCPHCGAEVVR